MWQDTCNATIDDVIRSSVMRNLQIEAHWIGNPSDSTFGIMVGLMWNGNYFGSTVINFIDEKR